MAQVLSAGITDDVTDRCGSGSGVVPASVPGPARVEAGWSAA